MPVPALAGARMIDLSHPITADMPRWAGDPEVAITTVAAYQSEGYFLQELRIGEHTGTHWVSPRCFHPDGLAADEVPVERLLARARVLIWRGRGSAVTGPAATEEFAGTSTAATEEFAGTSTAATEESAVVSAAASPDGLLSVADLLAWEERSGRLQPGDALLVDTGWSRFWKDPAAFIGEPPRWPGLHPNVAGLLLDRRISMLGVDTHGPDGGAADDLRLSRELTRAGVLLLECLDRPGRVPDGAATVLLGAPAITGGSGGPARVFALIDPA